MDFIGREAELQFLAAELEAVGARTGTGQPGRCVVMRGRRRVGKSRLVERFLASNDAPSVFFTASRSPVVAEVSAFVEEAGRSTVADRELITAGSPQTWDAAFRLLAAALPTDQPSVVVIDEVPYLMDDGHVFEGVLQRAWDRLLCRKPVLLILIGSDLAMMEALNEYSRPFHQRGREMVIGPLSPHDVAAMIGRSGADSIDASLVTGGLPLLCADWQPREDVWSYLSRVLADSSSPFVVSAERSLAAEFPAETQARTVLSAIGSGERTFSSIGRSSNGISASPLHRALGALRAKRMVAGELPISTTPSKERRYRIIDPYLRFWLQFVGPHLPEIERGRGDLTMNRVRAGWSSWRGRAVEPVIREALLRSLPLGGLPAAAAVGAYWTRTNDVEVDIVGADRAPIAGEILFVGSIKWRENDGFDSRDLATLLRHRDRLTADLVPTLAVTRTGTSVPGPDLVLGPDDILRAWDPVATSTDDAS